uniref:LINE-1 retrotransposable element ORF1 protein n=1 Tax=Rattus norvegicus TaxID=10116 RepID=Q4JFV6_RAT|nr:nucleic acid binding protein [Rattus norvegicus]
MARGKRRNPSNRNQDYMASSEPNSPTKANTEYPNTLENQDLVSKSYLIMMLEDVKKDVKNSLREQVEAYRQESQKSLKEFKEIINKQVEAHREESQKSQKEFQEIINTKVEAHREVSQKSLKEFQENTIKQLKELKMEIEAIKKEHMETTLDIENQKKRQGVVDTSFTNRIQEMEERISGAEDSIEIINSTVKDNVKWKELLVQNIQEIQDSMRRSNLRIIGIEESEDSQLKGPVNIFDKIIEENFPNLKKEIPIGIQEAYRTPNRLDQKRNTSRHIIVKTPNAQNKERILKAVREKGQVTYKGRPIRITPDFSPETMKARRSWTDVIQTLREHKCQPRLLYPTKLSINIDGETKIFHDKTKFIQYLSTNPALQRIIKGKAQHKEASYTLEEARN